MKTTTTTTTAKRFDMINGLTEVIIIKTCVCLCTSQKPQQNVYMLTHTHTRLDKIHMLKTINTQLPIYRNVPLRCCFENFDCVFVCLYYKFATMHSVACTNGQIFIFMYREIKRVILNKSSSDSTPFVSSPLEIVVDYPRS